MREIDIKFNVPPYVDKAADYIQECVKKSEDLRRWRIYEKM